MANGVTEYAAGFEFMETERGVTVTRIYHFDPDSTVDGPDLPKPGETFDASDYNATFVPTPFDGTALYCRTRSCKSLGGHPDKIEWTVTYTNEPVDVNVFFEPDNTAPDVDELPQTVEYSGEMTLINPINDPVAARWKWKSDLSSVAQPIPKRVNTSTIRIVRYVSDEDYSNFTYAVKYLSGKLNDNTFLGSDIGNLLFIGCSTEYFRNVLNTKWWRAELEFLYRSPDSSTDDGWQKILRLTGAWDTPLMNGDEDTKLYQYGVFNALIDMTISPIPE